MRRYTILIVFEPWDWENATPEVRQEYFDAHHAFETYVAEHGKRLAGSALCDADTATTVGRGVGEERVVTDGPFVELSEQVGGYYDVELPDLDTAIAAARLLPEAYTLEIRPVMTIDGYGSV
ncbi:hypothetical protein JQN72_09395 [Phycicoccus sp. CSK15P-2]|uniref:YciI family protein n=1 Tax=Phycicoccus sp. CSK15P-2 TaxID=2807627 RepID=UPI001950CB90|nr:YciI family protein [Phycicoccus sp. CSK15P-2]MBM6404454.1 hypothetical protein [Phycicoccus sp. CSK15P-2]